ncbi:MAG: ABC transporter substrate-binding protein [Sciscionella sp.]
MGFGGITTKRRRFSPTGRRLVALALGGLLASSLAACDGQHAAAVTPERATLRIGTQGLIDDAPLYIAQDKQLFAGTGMRVQLIPEDNDQAALSALRSGAIDLAFTSDVGAFSAVASGTKLQVQAEAYQAGTATMAIATRSDMRFTDPSTLDNVTVAVPQMNDLGTMVTTHTLMALGVKMSAIKYVKMPFKDMIPAIQNGTITGGWLEEPYLTQADRQLGSYDIPTDTGGHLHLPMSSYSSTQKFAEQNPHMLQIFRTVLSKAQGLAADRHEVQRVLPEYAGVDATTAALVSIGTFPTSLSTIRLQRVADMMQSARLLNTRLDVQALVPPALSS